MSFKDFEAGWRALLRYSDHDWGPSPPNNPEDAWLAYQGKPIPEKCPDCLKVYGRTPGKVVKRNGKHGEFFGCSLYPQCTWTRNLDGSEGYKRRPKSAHHEEDFNNAEYAEYWYPSGW